VLRSPVLVSFRRLGETMTSDASSRRQAGAADPRALIVYHFWRRVIRGIRAHYAYANRLDALERGATTIIVVGGIFLVAATSAIAANPTYASVGFGVVVTLIGIGMTTIGVVQAVYKWGRRSSVHKNIGARYANLRRDLQYFLLTSSNDFQKLQPLIAEASELSRDAELLPTQFWLEADREEDFGDASVDLIEACMQSANSQPAPASFRPRSSN
jgi:hypothetical protein